MSSDAANLHVQPVAMRLGGGVSAYLRKVGVICTSDPARRVARRGAQHDDGPLACWRC